jgi:two-component system, chemotaxis family, chemotaxis protein CheY
MSKIKALVVDDSKVMRLMVMRALNRIPATEFEFIEAGDGSEALNLFKEHPVDMAFVDWNMPTMSGIEFVRHVRSMPSTDHVRLVMVTSEKTVAKIDEALEHAGANAYICKPFTEEEVGQKVGKILQEVNEHKAGTRSIFSRFMS